MSTSIEAAIAVNRFGLGARPGELEALGSPRDWLRRQLRPDGAALSGEALKSSQQILAGVAELAAERDERGEAPAGAAAGSAQQQRQQQLATRLPRYYRPIYVAEARARLHHAVTTDYPFL